MTPIITYGIIGMTTIISMLSFSNQALLNRLIFYPYEVKRQKEFGRFISHGFVHANWTHLIFNMLTLYFFGGTVEQHFVAHFGAQSGRLLFAFVYLSAIIISSIPSYFRHKDNSYYRSLGASGAVSAALFASIIFSPLNSILIIPIPIPIPAWLFGPLYLLYSAYMSQRGSDNIGHDAHFMGALYGLIITVLLIPSSFGEFVNTITALFN